MLIVIVDVHVKPEHCEAFIEATEKNAALSRLEPGIARFDVLREQADPGHFQLVEIYRTKDAPAAHKQTAHYQVWRDTVEPMMREPRGSTKFENVSPDDSAFG
jgi:quinol monooxygenase YgiN